MARRRSSRSSSRSTSTRTVTRKSEAEARVERMTWALLVLIFAVMQLAPELLPTSFVPLAGAVVLLGSGIYQYSRHWRVSPVTWIAGMLMAMMAFYNLQFNVARNFSGEALLIFFGVILFGLFTGET